jgi:MoaA/NifB/PqqE/SkfB family radical SAM enzyme
MINFVLMHINFHQVEEILRLAGRLGIDQVNYKQCDVIRGNAGRGLGLFGQKETREIRQLKKSLEKAKRLAKKLKIQTTLFAMTARPPPVSILPLEGPPHLLEKM